MTQSAIGGVEPIGNEEDPVMVFQILAVLVALSLPALLVIEEINSWRKSHRAPGREDSARDRPRHCHPGAFGATSARGAWSTAAQDGLKKSAVFSIAREDEKTVGWDHDLS